MTARLPSAGGGGEAISQAFASWHVVSQASERGSAAFNEDACGAAGAQAWIVDGSAFFSGPPRLTETSEGAWLVEQIDRWFRSVDLWDASLNEAASVLEAALVAAYAALSAGQPKRYPGEGPSAVFAVLRIRPEGDAFRLDAMLLGDVSVLIGDQGETARWTDERVAPFEARTIAAASASGRGSGVVIAPAALAQIIENRGSLNREGGYWAINPSLPWQAGLRFMSRTITPQAMVLLASDGFMRLVDVVGRYDERGLLEVVRERGVESLIAELREVEREDGDASRFARVKIHDDATALVIRPNIGR